MTTTITQTITTTITQTTTTTTITAQTATTITIAQAQTTAENKLKNKECFWVRKHSFILSKNRVMTF